MSDTPKRDRGGKGQTSTEAKRVVKGHGGKWASIVTCLGHTAEGRRLAAPTDSCGPTPSARLN